MEKLTEKLAEFCENIKFENLPKDVVERTKKFALELDRFTNKPLSEIQEIINSEEVKEILNWNYNLLRSEVNKESTLDKIFLNKFRYSA